MPHERRVLRRGGILYLPNLFDALWVCLDEPWRNAVYPADGAAALWPVAASHHPAAAHLVPLIGRSQTGFSRRLNLVLDGGIADGRPAGARFVPVRELGRAVAPARAARVAEALAGRVLPFLRHGQRAA